VPLAQRIGFHPSTGRAPSTPVRSLQWREGMLQPLGISAEAEAVYVALGPLPSASVSELARVTSLTPEKVAETLEQLRSLGLATDSSRGNWRALPLLDVVNQLKAQRWSEIELASVAAESLEGHLLAAGASQADEIKTLVGRQTIVAAHRELMDSARREICFFDKPPYAQVRSTITEEALSTEPEWQALERNVILRCVYDPGFDTDRLAELSLFAKKGEQSRTSPVPMKLIIIDGHTALIPSMRSYAPGHELRASIVRNALLVEALQWLFEAVWEAAVPIQTTIKGESDPRRQMLISLLMTGSTDSAIANTLNINVRSVRRWISELMDELGVTTRLQLGAALVRSDGIRGEQSVSADIHSLPQPSHGDQLATVTNIPKPRPRS
jgi:sugar-specific transcriptional regulator TrmB/DNA-binding CsgD family transcriptional regulator